MSYMRGEWYIWEGSEFHINELTIPKEVLDEFVVMRFAEMGKKERERAEKRAIKKHTGNFGCDVLLKKYGMPTAMDVIKRMAKNMKKGKYETKKSSKR